MTQNSERFSGLTLNERRVAIYGLDGETDRKREVEGAEGRNGVKTGFFEVADLFLTVLEYLTLTFE